MFQSFKNLMQMFTECARARRVDAKPEEDVDVEQGPPENGEHPPARHPRGQRTDGQEEKVLRRNPRR